MQIDYLDRAWADNHHRLSGDIHKLFRRIGVAMERLNAIQFDAPWRRAPVRRRRTAH